MSDLNPHIRKLLRDIDVSARRVIARMESVSRGDFIDPDNLDMQDIVARRLSIIGEAAAALCKRHEAFCEAHPEIPLRQARGMRNILVHDYDGIDWDTVWNTARHGLPELIEAINPLIHNS